MAKVSFTNLKLKPNTNISEVIYNDQKIEVLNYYIYHNNNKKR